jgi:protein involved in polysaccharide export with SLBB domain
VTEHYLVGFPDALEIHVADRPEITGQCSVGIDGNIDLGQYHRVRVEGHPLPDIVKEIASRVGVPAEQVHVRVLDYQSEPVFLFGQVVGWQRTVPYQGQETVLELLQRVGGITRGAAPDDVYVVRSHLDDGQRPQVFHVDLAAIVLTNDEHTNIRLLPYDQVYVGETRRAKLMHCLPVWMRPLIYTLTGTRPLARPPEKLPTEKREFKGPS